MNESSPIQTRTQKRDALCDATPINLYPHQVKELLEDGQTTLYRLIEPQPVGSFERHPDYDDIVPAVHSASSLKNEWAIFDGVKLIPYPFGDVGECHWGREVWGVASIYDHSPASKVHHGAKVGYAASGGVKGILLRLADDMPRHFSRFDLRVSLRYIRQLKEIPSFRAMGVELPSGNSEDAGSDQKVLEALGDWSDTYGMDDIQLTPSLWFWCIEVENLGQKKELTLDDCSEDEGDLAGPPTLPSFGMVVSNPPRTSLIDEASIFGQLEKKRDALKEKKSEIRTAYLIERKSEIGPLWFTIYPAAVSKIVDSRYYSSWSNVAQFALKFADRESAEAYIALHSPSADCFASDHTFESLPQVVDGLDDPNLIQYNKLVRDRMPEIVRADGNEAGFITLDDEQFKAALKAKLLEEVNEYLESGEATELADVLAVLERLADECHHGMYQVRRHAENKLRERGGFARRLFMTWAVKKRDGNAKN